MAARDRYTLVEVGVAGGVAGSRPKSLSEHVQVRKVEVKLHLTYLDPPRRAKWMVRGAILQTP